MALTLDATVGGASSTAYLTDAGLLALALPHATDSVRLTAAQPDSRARALIAATRRLDMEEFAGYRATPTQALAWPRTQVWDADLHAFTDNTALPKRLLLACYALAVVLLDTAPVQQDAPALDGPDPLRDIAKVGGELSADLVALPLRLDVDDLQRWPSVWRPLKPLLLAHAPQAPAVVDGSLGVPTVNGLPVSRFAVLRSQRDGNGCRDPYGLPYGTTDAPYGVG